MADSTHRSKQGVEANKYTSTMAKHPEFICFVLAIICTILTNFTHSLKQQKAAVYQAQPPPKHFFRSKSIVLDFPYGNLNNVGGLLEDEEVLFVMFYAPWCAKSVLLKTEFEKAAIYMKNQITFVAINCWYGHGQCRKKNDFHTFPVFYLYFSNIDGFRYTDIPNAENMVRFAEALLYPLTYLTTEEDLVMFLSQSDNAVIGYFDFNNGPQPPGFQQYYYSSMRAFESDPWNSIGFGLITRQSLASKFGMEASKTVYLCRALNHTLKYPHNNNFTMTLLTKWIFSMKTASAVKWVTPSGVKSLQLSTELNKGPAVLAFVPDAPLLAINQYYSMMREVVLLYKNCAADGKWPEMAQSSQYARWSHLLAHFDAIQECNNFQAKEDIPEVLPDEPRMPYKKCCLTLTFGNSSTHPPCDACLNYEPDSALASKACNVLSLSNVIPSYNNGRELESLDIVQHGCSAAQPNYNPTEFVTFCCYTASDRASRLTFGQHAVIANVYHEPKPDPFVVKYTENYITHRCRKLRLQRDYKWLPPIDVTDLGFQSSELDGNISQLGCDTNRSLNFYTVNAALSEPLQRSLGVATETNVTDFIPSSVVIIDLKNDFQYRMKESFSKQNLAYLIKNFTENNLGRYLRSEDTTPRGTCNDSVCIIDITTQTFNATVLDPDKDVVLLHYAPWCGFCVGFAHVYLSLAKYFKSANSIIFARINADKNDLPWQYTVDVYPTISIYPAHRKENTEIFPDHLQKTLSNLVLFVLKYSTHSVKLQTSLEICSNTCITSNIDSSLTRLHALSSQINILQQKLLETETQISELNDIGNEICKKKIVSLRKTANLLSLLLNRKHFQEKNTRNLYNSLRTSGGKTLEKHKMLTILKQYSLFDAQFRKMLNGASWYLFDSDAG